MRRVVTMDDDGCTVSTGCRVFEIAGAASAQLPIRLLNLFAQQDILPRAVTMTSSEAGIAMRILEGTLDDHRAAIILAKIQSFVEVEAATLDGTAVPPVGLAAGA